MSPFKRIFHFVLAVWFSLGVSISLILTYPLLFIFLRVFVQHHIAKTIRTYWLKFCLCWGGIRVKTIYESPLSNDKAYLFTPNHTSKLDMITLPTQLGSQVIFMAKEEFKYIPLFGIFFKTLDIPVNFNKNSQIVLAMRQASKALQKGINLIIFPEGKIGRHTPKLSPFKNGAFKLAIENQVDVVPVTIIDNWKLLSDEDIYYYSPGEVIKYVHTPISTKGMTKADVEALKQQVFHIIAHKLAEYGYKQ